MFELYLNGTLSCTADMTVVWDDAVGDVSPDVLVLGAHYEGTSPIDNLFAGTIIDAMMYASALPAPFLAAIASPSTIPVPYPTGTATGDSLVSSAIALPDAGNTSVTVKTFTCTTLGCSINSTSAATGPPTAPAAVSVRVVEDDAVRADEAEADAARPRRQEHAKSL